VNDASLLARMLNRKERLPTGLTFDDFANVDSQFRYRFFWCQVFPRDVVFPTILNGLRGPFTKLIGLANNFEKLMEDRQRANETREWWRLVSAHARRLVSGVLQWIAENRSVRLPRPIRQRIQTGRITSEVINDRVIVGLADRWNAFVGPTSEDSLPETVVQ
jgi:hypothetical protein